MTQGDHVLEKVVITINSVFVAILVAVAVWSVSFFVIHSARAHVRWVLLAAILGALVVVVILAVWKKFELASVNNALQLLFVGAGAGVGIAVGTIVIGCIPVNVSCLEQPASANPDEVVAYINDSICWYPSDDNYTVVFKQSNRYGAGNGGRISPIKNSAGTGEEVFVRVLKSGTYQKRTVDVPGGYYWYDIKCDNGHDVDPKVRVPPR
jgi:hypothetical protein